MKVNHFLSLKHHRDKFQVSVHVTSYHSDVSITLSKYRAAVSTTALLVVCLGHIWTTLCVMLVLIISFPLVHTLLVE